MKYFGKKSLSSVMSRLLLISWCIVLLMTIVAPLAAGAIIFFSTPKGDAVSAAIQKGEFHMCGKDLKRELGEPKKDWHKDFSEKDRKDWEKFKKLPLAVKVLILPYFETVLILLLFILKKSRFLFNNFKNGVVFNTRNVQLISKLSKMLIVFSIMTCSFSSLLLCVVVLLLCEILKNGTALQEEHDLTV